MQAILDDFSVVIERLRVRRPTVEPVEAEPVVEPLFADECLYDDMDIKNLFSIHQECRIFYQRVRATLLSLSSRTRKSDFTTKQLADIGYMCREMRSQFEEIRKDVDANKSLMDRIFCITVLTKMLATASADDTVKAKYCSAKPHYKKSVTLPKKDTTEHLQLCKYFGISDKGVEMGVAKVSWKRVCDHVSELAEFGQPIPEFLPKVFDDYTVIHRRK